MFAPGLATLDCVMLVCAELTASVFHPKNSLGRPPRVETRAWDVLIRSPDFLTRAWARDSRQHLWPMFSDSAGSTAQALCKVRVCWPFGPALGNEEKTFEDASIVHLAGQSNGHASALTSHQIKKLRSRELRRIFLSGLGDDHDGSSQNRNPFSCGVNTLHVHV
jgi:hypothetical protein